jgi:predicted nucleic acid-binding protein
LLNSIKILDLTLESLRKSSEILSALFHRGEPTDLRDAIIARISLIGGCKLVTRNTEHFKRVTGLDLALKHGKDSNCL